MPNQTTADSLAAELEHRKGDLQGLTRSLDRKGERFLSFSKVSTVESCEYRYLLEYVERVPLDPRPDYFVKGGLFHQVVARHYREYVRRRFDATACRTVFDQYRWVNNLDRIRKPALQRSVVKLKKGSFARAVRRVARADEVMRKIEEGETATAYGECFKCPFKPVCPQARSGWY